MNKRQFVKKYLEALEAAMDAIEKAEDWRAAKRFWAEAKYDAGKWWDSYGEPMDGEDEDDAEARAEEEISQMYEYGERIVEAINDGSNWRRVSASGRTAKRRKKRPLNQERRMKKMLKKKDLKTRGAPIPPRQVHKDKRKKRKDRGSDKAKLRKEHVGMDRNFIASELVKAAKTVLGYSETVEDFLLDAQDILYTHKSAERYRGKDAYVIMSRGDIRKLGRALREVTYIAENRKIDKLAKKAFDIVNKRPEHHPGGWKVLNSDIKEMIDLVAEAIGMDVVASRTAGRINTRYNYPTEKKAKMLPRLLSRLKIPAKRLSERDSFSINDEMKVHKIYDKLMDIDHELSRIDM
jgi:hypothetical protein